MGKTDKQEAVINFIKDIEKLCCKHQLNLTIHDGKIGFVDQKQRKIIAVWSAKHPLPEEQK